MARPIGKLSAIEVSKAKQKGLLSDGGGLYLQVSASGSKSWVFRFMLHGRSREMGLGSANAVSLADARARAADCRKLLSQKIDPIEIRQAEYAAKRLAVAKTISFKQCAEAYIDMHKAGWKNEKHISQWRRTLETYAYPCFGNTSIQAIDVALVIKVIEPIWNKKPETASRLRARIESILDWASAREYRQGENPARWRGHMENLLPKKSKVRRIKHHPALPYAEIEDFMIELKDDAAIAARALEFTILTASRTSEAIGAKWSEINLKEEIWVVPAHRIKAGREHRVPLSKAAMAVLREMELVNNSDFVFPGTKKGQPLSNMAMLALKNRMGKKAITIHGFRSTFRDWAAEQTNFPREVAEAALAHAVGDKTEAAYRRGDLFKKRRQLMEAWGRYCVSPGTADAQPATDQVERSIVYQ
jgi:integrase